MKTINVSEATGPALNWLVAVAEGLSLNMLDLLYDIKCYSQFNPSTDWSQGGPIIERERITVSSLYVQKNPPIPEYDKNEWGAYIPCGVESAGSGAGPTPLIAAMRCYVISKLGETAEVPEGPL